MPNKEFTYAYYRQILENALLKGYDFLTLGEFFERGKTSPRQFILRHDIDKNPHSILPLVEIEESLGVRSTIFVRVAGADYNFFSYATMSVLNHAATRNFEIGLHTNFYEFAHYAELDPLETLEIELDCIRTLFNVNGIACHRDINYTHNSLPFLVKNWILIKKKFNLRYQAYDEIIMNNFTFVNEGLNPHLCWRQVAPEDAIHKELSVYLSTHNHWWYEKIPYLS